MSFFPPGFDPRADVVGLMDLVSIDTPDGLYRFLLGTDGRFVDVDDNTWLGSQLIIPPDVEMARGGVAPSGALTLTFIPDPADGDLVAELRALGQGYIDGREIAFWVQPLNSIAEFYAPTLAPIRVASRRATSLGFDLSGPLERTITLDFEGPFIGRNTARGYRYTTEDHARLTGAANSSLRFMPGDTFQNQRLFG